MTNEYEMADDNRADLIYESRTSWRRCCWTLAAAARDAPRRRRTDYRGAFSASGDLEWEDEK
jgi:hypothetical protein